MPTMPSGDLQSAHVGGALRHFSLSLRVRWIQKTRASGATCCEILLPIVLVALFAVLYGYTHLDHVAPTTYECAGAFVDGDAADFVYLPRALTVTGTRLAVVGDADVRTRFTAYLNATYPGLSAAALAPLSCELLALDSNYTGAPRFFPSFDGLVLSFDSEAHLEAYISAPGYGTDHPGVHVAVVFVPSPDTGVSPAVGSGHWAYRVRPNVSDVPDTRKTSDDLQLGPNFGVITSYFMSSFSVGSPTGSGTVSVNVPGFIPLQTAVDRFILNASAAPSIASGEAAIADVVAFATQWGCINASSLVPSFSSISSFLQSHTLLPQRVRVAAFPTDAYRFTAFYSFVNAVFALLFVLTFFFPSFYLIRGIVMEKEAKLREGMRMMGMSDLALTAAWYATYTFIFFIIAGAIALTVKLSFFPTTDGGLIFLFFWLFGIASTSLCYLISVFFSRAKVASNLGALLFIAMFFPYFKVNDASVEPVNKHAGSLSASVAFGLALDIITRLEAANSGVTWANVGTIVNGYSVSAAFSWLIADTILYTLLAIYLSAVLPQEFGVPLAWHFPLSPAFWLPDRYGPAGRSLFSAWRAVIFGQSAGEEEEGLEGAKGPGGAHFSLRNIGSLNTAPSSKRSSARRVGGGMAGDDDGDSSLLLNEVEAGAHHLPAHLADILGTPAAGPHIEPPSTTLRELGRVGRSVAVRGLKKAFSTPDGIKLAVAGVDLDMYEGQIFVLLGHNGAGKSTTISMLTGLIPPTSGEAWAHGMSVGQDLARVRRSLGVCPQHDVLWPDLTVKEHLQFFAGIKGVPPAGIEAATWEVIRDVGLTEKVNALSADLSGGMKRKLSIAIALIGGSKLVFLDEPTSGMDPYSRRSTWNILQNARVGRTICLTTHFMDEADILGDRIAIMADGVIRCCGSSMYLKRLFGVGYALSIVKIGGGVSVDVDAITRVITAGVPEARLLSNVGAEVTYQLPLTSSPAFPAVFAQLEERAKALGIASYGVSVTTLEEVFIKVAEEGGGHGGHSGGEVAASSSTDPHSGSSSSSGVGAHGGDSGAAALALEQRSRADAARSAALGLARTTDPAADFRREDLSPDTNLFAVHFQALLLKRFRFALRDRRAQACQLIIPVLAVLGGLLLLRSSNSATFPPRRLGFSDLNSGLPPLTPGDHTGPNFVPFAYNASTGGAELAAFISSSGVSPSAGMYSGPASNLSFVPLTDLNTIYPPSAYPVNGSSPNCTRTQPSFSLPPILSAVADAAAEARIGISGTVDLNDAYALSQWLLATENTTSEDGASRYAAISIASLNRDATNAFASYLALTNTTAWHVAPSIIAIVNSGLLNWLGGSAANASITVDVAPLPFSQTEVQIISAITNFVAVLFIVIAFSFIPASFAVFVVKEREVSAKHQQLISGVSIPAYWLATYTWDCINYSLPCIACFILLVAFNTLVDAGRWGATLLLFVLFGTAVAPFTYVLSYAFSSHSSAQNAMLILNLLCLVLLLASFVMKAIPSTCAADASLRFVYRLLPSYALGNGLQQLSILQQLVFTESKCGTLTPIEQYTQKFTPWSLEAAGWPILYLALESVVYLLLAILIDIGLSFPVIRSTLLPDKDIVDKVSTEDSDVLEEAARVSRGHAEKDTIVIDALRKVYKGAKPAVRNLSFGVPAGEVFGFLGINGAGKTTTLKILSGDIIPTRGTARLDGLDILREQMKVRRLLGYCPQFDSLLELLTVREHLELYARIKGVPADRLKAVVDVKIAEFDLDNYANKLAGSLSGGNKRKLSVAIAMIGSPRLIFLDEPSTGMDPVARRFMWRVLSSIATEKKQCSIMLTTHSMEEAEALCNRIGIMVGGRLRCLGSAQHLKGKFGKGYLAVFKLGQPGPARIAKCLSMLQPHLQPPPKTIDLGGAAPTLGHWRLPVTALEAACATLGDSSRVRMVHPDSTGWTIAAAMRSELQSAEAQQFAEWWTVETLAALCHAFVISAFPGAVLVERPGGDFLRYQLPSLGRPLSSVFSTLEAKREALSIVDYSLGQMSLESVFNSLASQQDEEVGRVRGQVSAAPQQQHPHPTAAVDVPAAGGGLSRSLGALLPRPSQPPSSPGVEMGGGVYAALPSRE